jgi:hypothetical protein
MKQKSLLLLLCVAILFGINACRKVTGHGPVVKQTRTPASFNALKVNLPGEVIYTVAAEHKIEIEAQKNILDLIETPVVNSELELKFKEPVDLPSNEILRVIVSAPTLNTIVLNGSANLTTLGSFQPSDLFLQLKGSGNVNMPSLVTRELFAIVSGSGDLKVAQGDTFVEELSVNGSGSVDLNGVTARHATTSIKGSGSIKLNVSETMFCRITGSGSVYYKGNPLIETDIRGSGRVVKQ